MRAMILNLACWLAALTVTGQPQPYPASGLLQRMVERQETRGRLLARESVHLQTDRSWYLPGDTLWMRSQLLVNGLPLAYSQVIHLSICDSAGRILLKRILPADSLGAAAALIIIPRNWKPAWYALHAATQWMRNAPGPLGQEIFFSVRDPSHPLYPMAIPAVATAPTRISFYPEGGQWLAGMQMRVAVHTNDPEHSVSGIILNRSGDTLAQYQTGAAGWGSFSLLVPAQGELIARSVVNGEKIESTDIWPVAFRQPRMQTAWSAGKLYFKVEFPPELPAPPDGLVVARANGMAASAIPFHAEKGQTLFTGYFNSDSLPAGAISLATLGEEGQWLAGRSVFHEGRPGAVKIITDTLQLRPGGYNAWRVSLPHGSAGNYSILVTDAAFNDSGVPGHDLRASQLCSALNGRVPGSAGAPPLPDAMAMDAWMMSVIPDSAYWAALWRDAYLPDYLPETGLSLSGLLVDQKGRPASRKPVSFMIEEADSSSFFLSDSTDADGRIRLEGLAFVDSARVYWKIPDKSRRPGMEYQFIADSSYFDNLNIQSLRWPLMRIQASLPQPEQEAYLGVLAHEASAAPVLDTVLVLARKPDTLELMDQEYTGGGLFGGRLGFVQTFDMLHEPSSSVNIISWLAGRMANIRISGPSWGPTLTWMRGFGTGGPAPVIFFLNEVRMDDAGLIASLNMDEIAYVKIFKPPYSNVLTNTYSVVVAIYTRKGSDRAGKDRSGMKYFMEPGFTAYSAPGRQEQPAPQPDEDTRLRLYWDPFRFISNGEARIRFYNNAFSRRLRIRVQGISENGEVADSEVILQ